MAKATTADTKTETKPAKAKSAKPAKAEKQSIFARLAQYFRDVRAEMKRVVWPTPKEVRDSSVVVIVTLIFFVFFTLIIDSSAAYVLRLIRGIG